VFGAYACVRDVLRLIVSGGHIKLNAAKSRFENLL
jgi:hypothetical protein